MTSANQWPKKRMKSLGIHCNRADQPNIHSHELDPVGLCVFFWLFLLIIKCNHLRMGNALTQPEAKHYTKTLHPWDQARPEVVSLFNRYAECMSHYEKDHHQGFRTMVESRSTDTDGAVIDMLETMGLYSKEERENQAVYEKYDRFASDVLLLTRAIWTTAMAHPDMQAKVDNPDLLHVNTVITQLQHIQNEQLLLAIYKTKQLYMDLTRPAPDDNGLFCSVLTCWTTVDLIHSFRMNSMVYCEYHKGTALFNGLRHSSKFCGPCALWNILALKTTCGDPGHNHHHVSTLTPDSFVSSVSTNTSTRVENVDIQWHKSKGTPRYVTYQHGMHGHFYPMEEVYPHEQPKYYSVKHKRILHVPKGSVVTYPLNSNGLVDAWIQAEGCDLRTSCKRCITDLDDIHRIFEDHRADGNPMWRLTTKSTETPMERYVSLLYWKLRVKEKYHICHQHTSQVGGDIFFLWNQEPQTQLGVQAGSPPHPINSNMALRCNTIYEKGAPHQQLEAGKRHRIPSMSRKHHSRGRLFVYYCWSTFTRRKCRHEMPPRSRNTILGFSYTNDVFCYPHSIGGKAIATETIDNGGGGNYWNHHHWDQLLESACSGGQQWCTYALSGCVAQWLCPRWGAFLHWKW